MKILYQTDDGYIFETKEEALKYEELINKYKLDNGQKSELYLSLKDKIDIEPFLNKNFNENQLYFIRKAIQKKLNITIFTEQTFDEYQMEQIIRGLEDNLNISLYAKKEFNGQQMYEIRLGLQKGFDVWYINSKYEARIMFLARMALLFYPNSDFKSYIEQGFNEEQLELILQGLKEKLDITKYAKIEFDESKMKEIMKTLKKNNYENRKN